MAKVKPRTSGSNGKPTKLKTVLREVKAAGDAARTAEQAVEQKQATIERLVGIVRQLSDQRDGALAAHHHTVNALMRAAAEDASLMAALQLVRPKLPEGMDPDVFAIVDQAMRGVTGAMFFDRFVRAQGFEAVAAEMAEALRTAQHELDTTDGLVAFDSKAPGETMTLDFAAARKVGDAALAKYDALVAPPKVEEAPKVDVAEVAGATVTRIPGVEHTSECAEGMDAGHGCTCHGMSAGAALPPLADGADDPRTWVKGETEVTK